MMHGDHHLIVGGMEVLYTQAWMQERDGHRIRSMETRIGFINEAQDGLKVMKRFGWLIYKI